MRRTIGWTWWRMHRLRMADTSFLSFLLGALFVGLTPLTAIALPIYETAPSGPLAVVGDLPPVIVGDQSLGVIFHVSGRVTTGSIGGYFAEYTPGVESDIVGAIVRLHGPHDFPNSFDLTSSDVLGQTTIHIAEPAGNFSGDLSLTLFGGWYALVFAATGSRDQNNAVMPRLSESIGDPLFFFGRITDTGTTNPGGKPTSNVGFEYLGGGGLDGVRMFVDAAPASSVPEPSTLLLLGSGFAGLGGVAWKTRRKD